MTPHPRIAILGVTPLSLLLGRACHLADIPPIGLYDPDTHLALQGALILGISARRNPGDLDPLRAPLNLAILATPEVIPAALTLTSKDLFVLTLFVKSDLPLAWCQAQALLEPTDSDQTLSEHLPNLHFTLQGSTAAQKKGENFLLSLSQCYRDGGLTYKKSL